MIDVTQLASSGQSERDEKKSITALSMYAVTGDVPTNAPIDIEKASLVEVFSETRLIRISP
jgi:hypothetical protein